MSRGDEYSYFTIETMKHHLCLRTRSKALGMFGIHSIKVSLLVTNQDVLRQNRHWHDARQGNFWSYWVKARGCFVRMVKSTKIDWAKSKMKRHGSLTMVSMTSRQPSHAHQH